MKLEALLDDVVAAPAGTSKNQRYQMLAIMLTEHGDTPVSLKTVEAWFLRNSLPGPWLIRISHMAAKLGRPIDIASYS